MARKTFDGRPQTFTSLGEDLERLGVAPGMTLMVHSSLSALGWVVGGAPTVVRALLERLGPTGTLAMPMATPHGADPATWTHPEVPAEWLETVRDHLPVFDRRTTPTGLGIVPETLRTWPGTLRSDHPIESVGARGPNAADITCDHPIDFSEGPGGPFGKLHELDSWVLLLGVGFNRCTALHYAETLVSKRREMGVRFPTLEQGQRVWKDARNVADDNDTFFPQIGERYLATGRARQGTVGQAPSVLFRMRDLVEVAVVFFQRTLPDRSPEEAGRK